MRDIYLAIVLPIPPLMMMFFTAYALDSAFKYEYKNRRAAYIISIILGLLCGASIVIYKLRLEGKIIQSEVPWDEFILMGGLVIHGLILIALLRGKWWKRFLAVIITLDIISSIDSLFSNIQNQVFRLGEWTSDDRAWIIFIVYNIFVVILEFVFLYAISRLRSKNDNTPLPLLVMGIIMIVLQLVRGIVEGDGSESVWSSEIGVMKIVFLVTVLLIMMLFFYIRVTRKERDDLKDINKINEELIESQARFFEASAKADSVIRAMRHDMKNNIQVLMLLLEQKEYTKMQEYLEEMGSGLVVTDVSSHTGDVIADAIIAEKMKRAETAGIRLKVSGVINGVTISPVNMCKILGNLLDNAIEAASDERLKNLRSDIKVIDLSFKRTENFFMISVTNPCAVCPEIEDGKIVTSKSDRKNHGFGLQNIRSAAEDCGGELEISCEEKPFGYLFRAEVVM